MSRPPDADDNWRSLNPNFQIQPQNQPWFGQSPRFRGRGFNRQQSPRHWQRNPSTSPYQRPFRPSHNYYNSPTMGQQIRSPNFYQQNPRSSTPHYQNRFYKPRQDGNSNIDNWVSPQMWEDPWAHLKKSHSNLSQSDVDIPNTPSEPLTSKEVESESSIIL